MGTFESGAVVGSDTRFNIGSSTYMSVDTMVGTLRISVVVGDVVGVWALMVCGIIVVWEAVMYTW